MGQEESVPAASPLLENGGVSRRRMLVVLAAGATAATVMASVFS